MKSKYAFITLRDRPELMDRAAAWFHEKWRVPTEAYPSIDSLKEIARFFSVTIDDLICSDEMISVAENEKKRVRRQVRVAHLQCDGYPSGYAAVYTGIWKRIGFLRNSIPVWAERDRSVVEDRVFCAHRHYDLEWNLWSDHRELQQTGLEQA